MKLKINKKIDIQQLLCPSLCPQLNIAGNCTVMASI
jgi:hypothetical protein